MNPDDEVCCCYHVPLRKLVTFARRERPRVASQMSDCFGAGTGCGWCIPFLCRIHEAVARGEEPRIEMTPEEYAAARAAYRSERRPRNEFASPDPPAAAARAPSTGPPGPNSRPSDDSPAAPAKPRGGDS